MSVNWDAPDFGNRIHVGMTADDDHDLDEARAEARYA